MASYLSSLNPINSFPDYHGPHAVGTVDVELPAADLPAPCAPPPGAAPTVAFRIFYPCVQPRRDDSRPVRWVSQPQRLTVAALLRFLGLKERTSHALSYLTQQFYWIRVRAFRNAAMLAPPTSSGRWPVLLFSHGLAGSRNAYSYVCGDLASFGVVVVALDHRDGSSPVQYVRATAGTEARVVDTIKISHEPTEEVYEARDRQLRIRLWEISMAFEALMKIDAGQEVENLDMNTSSRRQERVEVLWQFDGKLDIHRAGKVSFCGHSFGAATMAQLVKSVYYSGERPDGSDKPLITPNADAAILHQIIPESPVLLLDMWGLPLQSPDQAWLWEKPLPSYAVGGPQGDNVLSVLSEGFHNWNDNLTINKHTIAAPSRSRRPSAAPRITREKGKLLPSWARLRDSSPSQDSGYSSHDSRSPARSLTRHASRGSGLSNVSTGHSSQKQSPERRKGRSSAAPGPHMFYVQKSQHFNHSDFGILFPWLARRFTKAEEPERILELNTRAMVQVVREAGIEVAGAEDAGILESGAGIRRWIAVPVEDERLGLGSDESAPGVLERKLSITSTQSRDAMNMGREMEMGVE